MRKLKAGLSVLIGNDQEKIEECAMRYLQYSTIHLEKYIEHEPDLPDFTSFMERDETNFLFKRKESMHLKK